MAEILRVDGAKTPVEPEKGKTFRLEQLQKVVGGYIEVIHLGNGQLMVMNEEGKVWGLPLNEAATALARGAIFAKDYIVGDVLVCDERQIK